MMTRPPVCPNCQQWEVPLDAETREQQVECPKCHATFNLVSLLADADQVTGGHRAKTLSNLQTAEKTIEIDSQGDSQQNLAPDTSRDLQSETLLVDSAAIEDSAHSLQEQFIGGGPPPEVPGYDILDELGQGGMGVVYRARQHGLNRIVALKMVVPGGHSGYIARARAEAESVAQLQHPHIVQIFEVKEHNGALFFAFEYVDGGPLDASAIQSPRHAAEIVETLARAAHYAHQRGIVHRDLKPANVLMTSDATPKIGDFGLAKRLKVDASHTQAGAIMGTPYYMSPEQAAGEIEHIGPESDIYALGCVLYELLAKRTPFVSSNVLEILEMVRSREPTPLRKFAPKTHADLETICLKCLEKSSKNRYGTALELAEDLRRFLDGEPIEARAISSLQRCMRWSRRNAMTLAVTSLVAVLVTFALVVTISFTRNRAEAARLMAREPFQIERPLGLPAFSIPSDNPVTVGKVALGRRLFFDQRLSVDNSVSCASCHDPSMGWSDGQPVAIGVRGQKSLRGSPTIVNAAYQRFLFWDGSATSLEKQALKPITNPVEMGMPSVEALVDKLNSIEEYRREFADVFPEGITADNIAAAIAAFERTLIAGNSPYDQFHAGDSSALSESARRGMEVFFHEGHCSACHAGPRFSDDGFHNIGVGINAEMIDEGRYAVTGRRGDRWSFKTPSLRDIVRSAPYMHDGSLKTLEEVIDFYDGGGVRNPYLDEEIFPLNLTQQQKKDLLEFLKTGLTSMDYPQITETQTTE